MERERRKQEKLGQLKTEMDKQLKLSIERKNEELLQNRLQD